MRITANHAFLNKELRNDNVFVTSELVDFAALTGMKVRKGYEQAVISEGEIVNVVGSSYGHLPNESYFSEVEIKLIDSGIDYIKRSINKNNRAFAVDYILNDESFVVKPKGHEGDKIIPMLRFTNCYDGSQKTSGSFGFFREICSNGLHIAETKIGFSMKKKMGIEQIVLPEISGLINKFMDNEYYQLSKKFEVLAETAITDLSEFTKFVCDETGIFQYVKSEKNPDASLNAQIVMDTITNEATALNIKPNLWLGYNAFNSILFDKFDKSFSVAAGIDANLFQSVLAMAN